MGPVNPLFFLRTPTILYPEHRTYRGDYFSFSLVSLPYIHSRGGREALLCSLPAPPSFCFWPLGIPCYRPSLASGYWAGLKDFLRADHTAG